MIFIQHNDNQTIIIININGCNIFSHYLKVKNDDKIVDFLKEFRHEICQLIENKKIFFSLNNQLRYTCDKSLNLLEITNECDKSSTAHQRCQFGDALSNLNIIKQSLEDHINNLSVKYIDGEINYALMNGHINIL